MFKYRRILYNGRYMEATTDSVNKTQGKRAIRDGVEIVGCLHGVDTLLGRGVERRESR